MGRLAMHRPPIIGADGGVDSTLYADPLPQSMVLTAIVSGFGTTAVLLVVLLALRGLTGTDHVDGREPDA
jgi:multicomponent K+:H+ antiporter subunit C